MLVTELATGESFIDAICGAPSSTGRVQIEGQLVHLTALDVESALDGVLNEKLMKARAVVLLVHHMDALSLNRIRLAHLKLTTATRVSPHLLLYRRKGQNDFKISCLACEQKLLVRYADVDRVGKCPHCAKPMRLPLPDVHLRTQLNLSKGATILPVSEEHPDQCRKAVGQMILRPARQESAFSSTMRIEILPEQT